MKYLHTPRAMTVLQKRVKLNVQKHCYFLDIIWSITSSASISSYTLQEEIKKPIINLFVWPNSKLIPSFQLPHTITHPYLLGNWALNIWTQIGLISSINWLHNYISKEYVVKQNKMLRKTMYLSSHAVLLTEQTCNLNSNWIRSMDTYSNSNMF
jgi:hypothetical protein